MGAFSVHPSSALIKFWQGIVEVSLRALCIGMSLLVFILAAATVGALSAPRTEVAPIESLRFNTRSPSGWLLLVTLIVLPLDVFLLVARFLNFSWVIEHIKIALGIDVVIKVIIGLAFFCGGIPLAVRSNDWRFWMGQGSAEDNAMYNIAGIVSSTSAAAAFSLLTSFAYAGLAVWLILFIVFNWDSNMTRYSPEFEVKVTRVGNSETSGVIDENPIEKNMKEQLRF